MHTIMEQEVEINPALSKRERVLFFTVFLSIGFFVEWFIVIIRIIIHKKEGDCFQNVQLLSK
ncbi:hypothetical protein EEL32_02040 [Brevibacillus laterosporus]|uniref:Uncharacterized protein n=1 Tax=Brevibacillus laterosporus TaxID=1465 RepID=A0A502J232_BRELA|nr:hypothetical protein EEL30_24015 [Brevibacillus laterosporus]TPG92098.1 hypothetical protein EEL32_02040 [Brevibacillus laterosporus]